MIEIYHHARCSHSRQVLQILETHGAPLRVIDYIKQPPSPSALLALVQRAGVSSLREWLREKDEMYRALGLKTAEESALYAAVAQYPQLLNRPIVVSEKGVALCRPPEKVWELL